MAFDDCLKRGLKPAVVVLIAALLATMVGCDRTSLYEARTLKPAHFPLFQAQYCPGREQLPIGSTLGNALCSRGPQITAFSRGC